MPKETKVTQKCRETLKSVFGHEDYREGQEAIIEALLEGRDVLALLPTGAERVCVSSCRHWLRTAWPSSLSR